MTHPVQLLSIPYYPNSADWFARIRHLSNPIWLDSGRPQSSYGCFDIISAAPATTLTTIGDTTQIEHNGIIESSTANPFELLKNYLSSTHSPMPQTPFCGGALGYFGYDLGRRLEKLPQHAERDIALPDMSLGIYPWAIVQNHETCEAWLIKNHLIDTAYNFLIINNICANASHSRVFHDLMSNLKNKKNSFLINKFENNLNVENYRSAVLKIQHYIAAGDCYQVNFAQRFSAAYEGDPFLAYLQLRNSLPSPFSAYMEIPQGAVLSLSPERFIKLSNGLAETKPIKGTIARGKTASEDLDNAATLSKSIKDRAENVMIVDLLRNDLSKTCTDVKVPELFNLQSFANVHHLVSTITGQLKPGMSALDVLASSFPGGSITGAPKIRAMEIIEELEMVGRAVYCGSLGYISTCGNMDTSIAIRTLLCDQKNIYCWGGGGIVADSEIDKEYQESIAKVKVLLDTLEQQFSDNGDF